MILAVRHELVILSQGEKVVERTPEKGEVRRDLGIGGGGADWLVILSQATGAGGKNAGEGRGAVRSEGRGGGVPIGL